jgi:hypothetical protein
LLLDATVGAMNISLEAAIDAPGEPDAHARLAALIAVLFDVRGLTVDQARETITGAAITLLDGALA